MVPRVLSVGNCGFDDGQLLQLMTEFGATMESARDAESALAQLRTSSFSLAIVNRKLDWDQSDGVELIRQIKADSATAAVPCLLLSNFPEAQQAAREAGAERGFGKAQLREPATRELLERILAC